MNDSELIGKFWQYNETNPLGAIAVSLYLFLLEIANRKEGFVFGLSDTEICECLKITRPTIISLRQKLQFLGLIEHEPKTGLPGIYKIITEYPLALASSERKEKVIPQKQKPSEKIQKNKETEQNQDSLFKDVVENPVSIPISVPLSGTSRQFHQSTFG